MGRIRALLVAELGGTCGACRRRPGVFVDHDHFTNLVRGLLCQYCNTHIDTCPHNVGCPWADYINDPRAAELRLMYPNRGRRGDQRKVEYLGFDPFVR